MKKTDQTCTTCKWREGTKRRKWNEYISDNDWCKAWKALARKEKTMTDFMNSVDKMLGGDV